jgi:hypothetical protein
MKKYFRNFLRLWIVSLFLVLHRVFTVVIIWNICKVSVVDMSRIFSLESLTLCLWLYQGVKKQRA